MLLRIIFIWTSTPTKSTARFEFLILEYVAKIESSCLKLLNNNFLNDSVTQFFFFFSKSKKEYSSLKVLSEQNSLKLKNNKNYLGGRKGGGVEFFLANIKVYYRLWTDYCLY